MARAAVDPDELQRFAGDLKRFTATIRDEVSSINRRFTHLEETWRDQEQERFADEFKLMVASMGRFAEAAEAHVPVLVRKSEAIRQYLNG